MCISDVMVMPLQLSRINHMAELVVTIDGKYRESHPRKMILGNVFDHLSCEGLMTQLSEIELKNPTTAQRRGSAQRNN